MYLFNLRDYFYHKIFKCDYYGNKNDSLSPLFYEIEDHPLLVKCKVWSEDDNGNTTVFITEYCNVNIFYDNKKELKLKFLRFIEWYTFEVIGKNKIP